MLRDAYEKWGFFQIENHGVDKGLIEKMKSFVSSHYEQKLGNSETTGKEIGDRTKLGDQLGNSNIAEITSLSKDLCNALKEYIAQLITLAEKLSELMCENLGLDKDHVKKFFSGEQGPSMGTKIAIYPQCSRPKGMRGLTDAGGIILLLQDAQVPGLEFLKDGQWDQIPPSRNNTIFVNTGDQVEVLSNGRYKSALHRVMAERNGSRLSIATFYNPASDAIISPAPKLLYPDPLCNHQVSREGASIRILEENGGHGHLMTMRPITFFHFLSFWVM